ncbi:MAG: GTPase HflX [Halopenitus sp.]
MSRDTQQSQSTRTGTTAVVAARDDAETPDTTEIRGLARAAGHHVVGEVTQQRAADPTYGLGRGKAETLMREVADLDVDVVVYDGELTPGQTFSLGELLPPGTGVIDRTRLVLDLFSEGANSRAAALQVELARLRYEKPRLAEGIARDVADENRFHDEGDKRVLDVERRIEAIERTLAEISDDRAARREQRRDDGFDLVAVAGYTNAGKSTLLHRLADDLSLDSIGADANVDVASAAGAPSSSHSDIDETVSVADQLFETLETTTRRATIADRRTLLTDTVGFVDALPHRSVKSFTATLDTVRNADVVLLVADATDDLEAFRSKLRVSIEAIGEPSGPVVPVLNKVDQVDVSTLQERVDAVAELRASPGADTGETVDPSEATGDEETTIASPAADALREPVPISAIEGDGVEQLEAAVVEALPTARTTLLLPNSGETQSLLAWAYDHGEVEQVAYESDRVRVEFAGNPSVVATAERKASSLTE